ncbi:hypothetical protein FA95DRAFT_1482584 [Auriscalpium vulgare]|uniref:Uncharacterized protein n=1 Tax=Auriscalpium vulgare TaxID=40419 RepID=A0ACB8SA74_9AGAM|nr:hypothetical protein FA95DRAFT_1482584 [Auriscalpium vulgare]
MQRPHNLQSLPASRSLWGFSSSKPAGQPAPEPESFAPTPSPERTSAASPPDVPISATATPDVFPDSIIPPSTLPYSDSLDTITTIAPLQFGDLAALGLAGWSPPGLSGWLLETINVSTGLPWFYTIIAGTVFARLLLLPFSIKQMQNSARLAPYQPRLLALKEEVNRAYATRDKLAVQRAALQQRKVYEDAGVSMLPMLAMPFVQLPVTLGMFFGVKRLSLLPLEQLHWSGVGFMPDLTVADPYYILPIISAVAMNVQLTVSEYISTADRVTMAHMINAFRIVSVISIPLMGAFPTGLNLYVLTSILAMLAQTSLLRVAAVRRTFGIPVLPKTNTKAVTFQESISHLKKYFREQSEIAQKRAAEKKW